MKLYLFKNKEEEKKLYDNQLENLIGINVKQLEKLCNMGLINIDKVFEIIKQNKDFDDVYVSYI